VTPPRIFAPEYYERMRQLEESSWWNAGMRDVASMLLKQASLPPAGLMLDVGCGSGQTMAWFARSHPGWRTAGLDVAWEGITAAHRARAAVCVASALRLPLADRSVDLAITLDVVLPREHRFRMNIRPAALNGWSLDSDPTGLWLSIPRVELESFEKSLDGAGAMERTMETSNGGELQLRLEVQV